MNTELYQEVLLQHSRRPRNFGPLEGATHRAEGVNAMCGDEIGVELSLADGVVRAAKFTGSACAICTASASILTVEVAGQPVGEARTLADDFRKYTITGVATEAVAQRPRLEVMGSVHKFPQRVKCATLPWETLLAAMENPAPEN
ncbi:MAG: SUF system NifU family Fe-S cluster assembly protein [Terrimicrobiaceae bacterium]|nr:SUF system NifU family Fe-S cluster assembly protein [Terrimicrobiaceae bacterium]